MQSIKIIFLLIFVMLMSGCRLLSTSEPMEVGMETHEIDVMERFNPEIYDLIHDQTYEEQYTVQSIKQLLPYLNYIGDDGKVKNSFLHSNNKTISIKEADLNFMKRTYMLYNNEMGFCLVSEMGTYSLIETEMTISTNGSVKHWCPSGTLHIHTHPLGRYSPDVYCGFSMSDIQQMRVSNFGMVGIICDPVRNPVIIDRDLRYYEIKVVK